MHDATTLVSDMAANPQLSRKRVLIDLDTLRQRSALRRGALQRRRDQIERLRDSIAPALLDYTHADTVQLSETEWARSWYVGAWPDHISPQLLFDLYTGQKLDCDLHIAYSIEPKSGRAISRQLANQATGIRAKQMAARQPQARPVSA